MRPIFITATGTGIGKTYVSRLLLAQAKGKLAALKPVISGFDENNMAASDSGKLLQSMGRPLSMAEVAKISPWRFAAAMSPDMAAKREARLLSVDEISAFCRTATAASPVPLLIEMVGGIMVPLNPTHTTLDWQNALDASCLLIAGTYLGTISHTLTALHVLASKSIRPAALILNTSADSPVAPDETAQTIAHYYPDLPMFIIPRHAQALPSGLLELVLAQ